jgi:putative ABC transport system ATP-binding protein
LEIARGEFLAVVGRSGSGKSTLLHLIAGIDTPSSGKISVGGHDLGTMGEAQRARLRRKTIGLVFQAFNLLGNLTVLQNVMLPALLTGQQRSNVRTRAEHLLELMGLESLGQRLPAELSGGQQQRVATARALINEPLFLLADEPTGNLDTQTGAEVLDVLQACHSRGQTIILVTHDADVAARAGRIVTLTDGQITSDVRRTLAETRSVQEVVADQR